MSLSRLTPQKALLISLGVLALAWIYTLVSYRMRGDAPVLSVKESHELLLGMGQLYELPMKRGPIKLSGDRALDLIRVGDDKFFSRYWLIGKGAGKTQVEFSESPRSDIPTRLTVQVEDPKRVSEKRRDAIIRKMLARERAKGITTKAIRIPMFQNKLIVLPFKAGPIFLGNPNVVSFERKSGAPNLSRVELASASPGFTNLYFMDTVGKPVYMLVVEVTGEETAVRNAASRFAGGGLPIPAPKAKFFDEYFGEKIPVY